MAKGEYEDTEEFPRTEQNGLAPGKLMAEEEEPFGPAWPPRPLPCTLEAGEQSQMQDPSPDLSPVTGVVGKGSL